MRTCAFLCLIVAWPPLVGRAQSNADTSHAWWTGSVQAASAATLPPGHCLFEPYFYDVMASLIGSDSGGAIAQIFVARYPERVRTLMLTNCDVHEDSPPPALRPVIAASRAGTFVDQVLVPQLRDKANARLATGLGGCCYTHPSGLTDEAIDCYLTPLASSPLRKAQFHGYCVALDRNPLLAVEPALRRCQAPLRVVWGTGDTIFDPSGPDWLDRTFPRSRGVRRVDRANLFFPEEMPNLIAEELHRLWG
jgi:pimeloyl-ACP methyl ester carboxylesterase